MQIIERLLYWSALVKQYFIRLNYFGSKSDIWSVIIRKISTARRLERPEVMLEDICSRKADRPNEFYE